MSQYKADFPLALLTSGHSEETKRKIAAKAAGRVLSDDHKRAIGDGARGKKHSAETIQKMRDQHAALTDEVKSERRAKVQDTNFLKYGGSSPMSNSEVRAKVVATNHQRYGGPSPTSSPEIMAKVHKTWDESYDSGHPMREDSIRAKLENTCLERYGEPNTMKMARDAYLEQNSGLNPFQKHEVKEKIKDHFQGLYGEGVSHVSQTPQFSHKVKQTTVERYGVPSVSQRHIGADNMNIILNKEKLEELVKQYSVQHTASILGVEATMIYRYIERYNLRFIGTSIERAISSILDDLHVDYTQRKRKLIKPLELDFVIPEHKLAIEVGGLYWHSDLYLSSSYHARKLEMCESVGYRLLTIFEDEITHKHAIVAERIRYFLGKGTKGFGARKASIHRLSQNDATAFLDRYHIQGAPRSTLLHYGAFDPSGNIVAVMSFKPSWRLSHNEDRPWELSRFAGDGKSYPGLASKLFRFFVMDNPSVDRVVTYADRRWSQGDLYKHMGFTQTVSSKPSYEYVDLKRFSRIDKSKFRKKRIAHLVEGGDSMTETQIALNLGYHRIYDCGKIRFDWYR